MQSGKDPFLYAEVSPEQAVIKQKGVAAAVTLQKHVLARLAWSREVRKRRSGASAAQNELEYDAKLGPWKLES